MPAEYRQEKTVRQQIYQGGQEKYTVYWPGVSFPRVFFFFFWPYYTTKLILQDMFVFCNSTRKKKNFA